MWHYQSLDLVSNIRGFNSTINRTCYKALLHLFFSLHSNSRGLTSNSVKLRYPLLSHDASTTADHKRWRLYCCARQKFPDNVPLERDPITGSTAIDTLGAVPQPIMVLMDAICARISLPRSPTDGSCINYCAHSPGESARLFN